MRTVLIALLLAGCTDDGPVSADEDPRAVLCDSFRNEGYRGIQDGVCYFDVSDLDTYSSPFATEPDVWVMADYCGLHCNSGGNHAQWVSGAEWKAPMISWIGDLDRGVAVRVGEKGEQCIWTRCALNR